MAEGARPACGWLAAALAAALAAGLCSCDRPGPLSSAALGERALAPRPPEWGRQFQSRPLRAVFPATASCIGFIDRYGERYAGARRVEGWSWNVSHAQPVKRLAVVDAKGRMVAFGDGGLARGDVAAAHPEFGSSAVGWSLVSPAGRSGYALFGIDEASRSACYLGALHP